MNKSTEIYPSVRYQDFVRQLYHRFDHGVLFYYDENFDRNVIEKLERHIHLVFRDSVGYLIDIDETSVEVVIKNDMGRERTVKFTKTLSSNRFIHFKVEIQNSTFSLTLYRVSQAATIDSLVGLIKNLVIEMDKMSTVKSATKR